MGTRAALVLASIAESTRSELSQRISDRLGQSAALSIRRPEKFSSEVCAIEVRSSCDIRALLSPPLEARFHLVASAADPPAAGAEIEQAVSDLSNLPDIELAALVSEELGHAYYTHYSDSLCSSTFVEFRGGLPVRGASYGVEGSEVLLTCLDGKLEGRVAILGDDIDDYGAPLRQGVRSIFGAETDLETVDQTGFLDQYLADSEMLPVQSSGPPQHVVAPDPPSPPAQAKHFGRSSRPSGITILGALFCLSSGVLLLGTLNAIRQHSAISGALIAGSFATAAVMLVVLAEALWKARPKAWWVTTCFLGAMAIGSFLFAALGALLDFPEETTPARQIKYSIRGVFYVSMVIYMFKSNVTQFFAVPSTAQRMVVGRVISASLLLAILWLATFSLFRIVVSR